MSRVQHFVSISGGKDSTAVACLAVERMERRGGGNLPTRFLFADTGNEHPATIEHVAYLGDKLGIQIETVRANFDHDFTVRRENIRADWSREKRRTEHTAACKERRSAGADWRDHCQCPVRISPPVAADMIDRAISLLHPTGNPFLDLCMIKGRFPGVKTRFCTDELKLVPMDAIKRPLLDDGISIVEWIGERAAESRVRAKKPRLERIRWTNNANRILYRPIHSWSAEEVFAIAARHGLKPNPLYLQGMGRVGCMPCIMCKKGELAQIARRFPDEIARIRQWETIVQGVARRQDATFFCAKMVPGEGNTRAAIDRAVAWSRTSRGGVFYDLEIAAQDAEYQDEGAMCESAYGLCE